MSDLIVQSSALPVPAMKDFVIRPAIETDAWWVDILQGVHRKMVGWMPKKTIDGKIAAGHMLVAEARESGIGNREPGLHPNPESRNPEPVGYVIGCDKYFKREDVGVIYQINVVDCKQRSFVGAALLKAMFDRAAYGCRLFCCWCAQDIQANRFWEAMGFVPLAYRAGSEKNARIHIFWQKRIRAGDVTTPYWFPSETTGGSIRENRLVLPIPPGMHWSEVHKTIMPTVERKSEVRVQRSEKKKAVAPKPVHALGRLQFAPPPAPKPVEPPKPKREKRKNDPKLIAAARELRDRWLEQVNADPSLILPSAKYDVCGALPASVVANLPALPAAA